MFHRLLLSTVPVGLLVICSPAIAEQSGLIVQTTTGSVKGIAKGTMVYYLGVPYAEPPVGKLRWHPPQPKRSWKTILDATEYRDHCIQFPLNKVLQLGALIGASEDCLFVNVYAQRTEGSRD